MALAEEALINRRARRKLKCPAPIISYFLEIPGLCHRIQDGIRIRYIAVLAQGVNDASDLAVDARDLRVIRRGGQRGINGRWPVGLVWIDLSKEHYGIHGTPSPEQVGRTESHGCFRLANWNAEYLLKLVWVGMPAIS